MAHGLLDSDLLRLQTLEHLMQMSHSWDSMVSLLPKGGEAIWGGLDSDAEEGHNCIYSKRKSSQLLLTNLHRQNYSTKPEYRMRETTKYGRIIAFGKRSFELPSSQLSTPNIKELSRKDGTSNDDTSCGSDYNEMSKESVVKAAENKAYTATTVLDLLRLPYAPEMEMYCLYGVGIPTERSYIYKLSTSTSKCKSSIPFRIDGSVDGDCGCLKGGTRFTDGDGSVPVISAGFMCAKGWRGKTRFNPSGMDTFLREYKHKPPGSLLESRGTESGAHVDIMGNVGLIEDVLRIVAGASGQDIGGDRVYSDVMEISERISIKL